MARTTAGGLYVWDLNTDPYDHNQLAANWDLVQSYWVGFDATSKLPRRLHTTATVPVGGTLGDIVFLTAANGGFQANTFLRYDGAAWRNIGFEIVPALPTSGNYAGRMVLLSAADATNNFPAYSLVRYDGAVWDYTGMYLKINNGAGATNIKGVQAAFDTFISDSARGLVLKDRGTGTNYRLYINNGVLGFEVVT